MEYQTRYRSATVGSNALDTDQGLRAFMLGVYNRMAGALALTGLVAYWASGALLPLINGGMWLVLALLPLPFVLAVSYGVYRFILVDIESPIDN
jgi:FtsH-binding integral membrane protein